MSECSFDVACVSECVRCRWMDAVNRVIVGGTAGCGRRGVGIMVGRGW